MSKFKILIILSLSLILTSCNSQPQDSNEHIPKQEESQADFATIKSFLEEKLSGQTLLRTYGEDTGQTKIIFEKDGTFRGDYFGKIAADGKDYGLSDIAAIWYEAEEIHSSEFEGKFEITKMIDEYSYEMVLKEFEIKSEIGAHDDIYYNVDFALGMNKEAKYILYRPAIEVDKLADDQRLRDLAKKKAIDGKVQGFIIYNQTDKEVFTQNQ